MSYVHPNDQLREKLRQAMDHEDANALQRWASSDEAKNTLQWQIFHEAWAQSSNPSMLTWKLLRECIELSHAHFRPVATSPLSTLHAFAAWQGTPPPRWIEQLDDTNARAFIDQAVTWRLMEDRGDAYSMQCMETAGLFQLSVGCKQGWIWQDRMAELSTYPMECSHAMQCTEEARCTDPNMYAAIWAYQQMDTTRVGWKRQALERNQLHNLAQLSNTPFIACEYVLEQHAQYDCHESYAQIVERSLFSEISELDEWMLNQLSQPSGTWETAGCPEHNNPQVQAWWYALQLGVDDVGLLQTLSQREPEGITILPLPEGSFTPS